MPKFTPKNPFKLYKDGTHYGNMSKNSQFFTKQIKRHIEHGGVPIHVYRLKGTFAQDRDEFGVEYEDTDDKEATDIGTFMGIQDTILGENRDRDYDFDEIPVIRGVYTVSQNELEYLRWGLGKANDIITMEFHAPSVEELLGRELMEGDVVELEHLRKVSPSGRVSNKWYEVSGAVPSPSGYDPMYVAHVIACTLRPLRHQQEFIEFFEQTDEYGKTLAEQASTEGSAKAISDHIRQVAEDYVPVNGMDKSYMWIDPDDPDAKPQRVGDNPATMNGVPVPQGDNFPINPSDGDWFLRTDVVPNRVYRFENGRWRARKIDQLREWQGYNWIEQMDEFRSDGSKEHKERPWRLVSIHDLNTNREQRSDPTGNRRR